MKMQRRLIASGSPFEPLIGFSRAVVDGHHVVVSGTAPVMPDGGEPPADAYGQAKRALEIIVAALAEAGAGPEHVVRTRTYLTDAADWEGAGGRTARYSGRSGRRARWSSSAGSWILAGWSRWRPTRSCRATPARHGRISRVTGRPAAAQHLRDLARLRRVRDRIDRDYAQPLDVEALARGAHMSAGHLSRQFRLAFGESPYSYLMTRRIERAMALLRRGDLSVTEVCFEVGCSSLGTFSTRFTELVGMPPSIYGRDATGAMAGMPPCLAKQVTRPIRNREAPGHEPQLV